MITTSESIIYACNEFLKNKEKQKILKTLQKDYDIDGNKADKLLIYMKRIRDEKNTLKIYQSNQSHDNSIRSYEKLIDIINHIKDEIKIIEQYEKER